MAEIDGFPILQQAFGSKPDKATLTAKKLDNKIRVFLTMYRDVIQDYIAELGNAMSDPKKDRKSLDLRVEILKEMMQQLETNPKAFFDNGRNQNLAAALADAVEQHPMFQSKAYISRLRCARTHFTDLSYSVNQTLR